MSMQRWPRPPVRISKREWTRLGGNSNPALFTRQTPSGRKTYWKVID